MKDKRIDLIERTFNREGSPYLHVTTETHLLLRKNLNMYHAISCQNVYDTLTFLLDNIFIQFGTRMYRQVVGIPMGTNWAPLVANLYEGLYDVSF